ncbi:MULTISPECIES: 30S ribosome-binding factor RbfA [Ferrimonas]|uniref:30S ribosome-binding factor RbfA n=1 Tax=Ferrimonas TaxID=44011 RepID=UPI000487448A|nr:MULTISPECIES: 30S ribosome-binding factor RbfA [Ferrimonas]USD38462.1 30S ribosome-binding factor RbfA [Ferrimonas sp. SCSIO 43195]
MAREFSRTRRVNQQIQRELATIMMREVRDARLGMVTINEVETSRDLNYAKVFVTFLDSEPEQVKAQMDALLELAPYIRSLLASSLRNMRAIPELRFAYDKSLVEGIRMTNVVTKVIAEDQAKADKHGSNDSDEEQQ